MQDLKPTVISSAYRDLAIGFLTVVFVVTVVRSLLRDFFGHEYFRVLLPIFVPLMIALFILSFRVINRLNVKRSVLYGLLGLLLFALLIRVLSFMSVREETTVQLSLASSLLIMLVWAGIVYRMVQNLFGESSHIVEKLWASVCIFFMIGIIFGSYYAIVLVINPDALPIEITHTLEIYMHGMIFSLNVLSGFDPVYPVTSESLQMGAIMESLLSTLFLVVLLGRLLGAPAQE